MSRQHSSWLLGYLAAVTLRAAAAERDADLMLVVYSHFNMKLYRPQRRSERLNSLSFDVLVKTLCLNK